MRAALLPSLLASLIPLAAIAAPQVRTDEPVTQNRETYGPDTWNARHDKILARHRTVKPEIVLLGDSITHFWGGEPTSHRPTDEASWKRVTNEKPASNLGFGFDYLENALWRVRNGELDGISPRLIVINLGTNNLGHKGDGPAECALGMKALLKEIRDRQPKARILLLGIYPRHETRLRDAITETNRQYAALAGPGIRFLDIGPSLSEKDRPGVPAKALFRDGLHPNAAGYAVIAEQLEPVVRAILAERS